MENIASIVEKAAKCAELEKKRYDEEIAQCEESILRAQTLKKYLKAELRECFLMAGLKSLGEIAWNELNGENKWKKENVLAVFLSGKVPREMAEFINDHAPESIRNDRDVLFARLAREALTPFYSNNQPICSIASLVNRESPFRVPQQFLTDNEVMIAAIHRYPEILEHTALPFEILDDSEVFRAFLTSDRIEGIWGGVTT